MSGDYLDMHSFKFRKWTSPSASEIVRPDSFNISDDDTIFMARSRIARSFDVEPHAVCMWVTRNVAVCVNVVQNFVTQLFRRRHKVDRGEVIRCFLAYVGHSAKSVEAAARFVKDGKSTKFLTPEQSVHLFTNALHITVVSETVGPKHIIGDWYVFHGANPFTTPVEIDGNLVDANGFPRHVYNTTWEDDIQLFEEAIVGCDTLEFALFEDVKRYCVRSKVRVVDDGRLVNGHLRKFFTALSNNAIVKSVQSSGIDRVMEHVRLSFVKENDKQFTVKSTSLRDVVFHTSSPPMTDAMFLPDQLYEVFAAFRVSETIPFVKFYDGNQFIYKLHRKSFSSKDITVTDVKKWTRSDDRPTRTFIRFYVKLPKPSTSDNVAWSKVDINTDLSMYIRRLFPRLMHAAYPDTVKLIDHVNETVVDALQSVLDKMDVGVMLPRINLGEWNDITKVQCDAIHAEFSAIVTIMSLKAPKLADLENVLSRMTPYFLVIRNEDTQSIIMQYKRVSSFAHPDRLRLVMHLLRNESRDAVVAILQDTFSFPKSVAEDVYSSFHDNDAQQNPYVAYSFRHDTVPTIVIKSAERFAFQVSIMKAPRHHHIDRIIKLVMVAISQAVANPIGFLDWVEYENNNIGANASSSLVASRLLEQSMTAPRDNVNDEDEQQLESIIDDELAVAGLAAAKGSVDKKTPTGNGKLPNGYLLDELYKADPAVFKYNGNGYATSCGKVNMRQPIVVTQPELDRMDKDSHAGAVAFGSTSELAERNRYICPRIWCPKSRVALSEAQLKKLNGKCPNADIDESPIFFDSTYWKNTDKRYVGFLNPIKHNIGLCMPCCFRRPGHLFDQCNVTNPDDGREASSAASTDTSSRYIKGAKVVPLDAGRLGVLPFPFSQMLGSGDKCGNRPDGSGQVTGVTTCFVRVGVPIHSQPFLRCMLDILDVPSVRDVSALIELVIAKLTPDVYISLNNGNLCRGLVDGSNDHPIPQFRKWFQTHSDYVAKFKLSKDVASLTSATSRAQLSPTLQREYMIFASMLNFFEYLRDDSIKKTHNVMLDLLTRDLPWLNPKGVNVLLFEKEQDDDTVTMPCSSHGHLQRPRMRLRGPFSIVLRQASVYETVQRVSYKSKFQKQSAFFYDLDPTINNIVNSYMQHCATTSGEGTSVQQVLTALSRLGHRPVTQVIDYSFCLAGFGTETGLFVPTMQGRDPMLVGPAGDGLTVMYIDEVARAFPRPRVKSVAGIKAIFSSLSDEIQDPSMNVEAEVLAGKRCVGLKLYNGSFVPVEMTEQDIAWRGYLIHLNVFIDSVDAKDERVKYIESLRSKEDKIWQLRKEVVRSMRSNQSALAELQAVRSPFHPFPLVEKRARIVKLLNSIVPSTRSIEGGVLGAVTDSLLFHTNHMSLREVIAVDKSNAIVFDDVDLAQGKLNGLIARASLLEPVYPGGTEDGKISAKPHTRKHSTKGSYGVWKTLQIAISFLRGEPIMVTHDQFASVIKNAIINHLKTTKSTDAALRDHPTLGLIGDDMPALLDAIDPPSYQPGVFDMAVIADFFKIHIVVYTQTHNKWSSPVSYGPKTDEFVVFLAYPTHLAPLTNSQGRFIHNNASVALPSIKGSKVGKSSGAVRS